MNIKIAIALVSLFLAWRFWLFYLIEDKAKGRRSFYLALGFAAFISTAIGLLRIKYPGEFRDVMAWSVVRFLIGVAMPGIGKWLAKYYLWYGAMGVAAAAAEIIFKERLSKKEARHGPEFGLKKGKTGLGLVVGKFDRKVLPKQIREFAPSMKSEIAVPFDRLSRGVTILGDMGSGKSRLMAAFVNGIQERYPDIPILIHDPKSEWLRAYYDLDSDLIFAPYDKRSAAWSLWRDFKKHPELRHPVISTAVESHHSGPGSDRFWTDSGIQLLKDIAQENDLAGAKTKLKTLKKRNEDNVTWRSIYSSAIIGLRDIAAAELMNIQSPGLGIDDFLSHPGRIFLLNNPSIANEQHGALTLLLSAFMIRALAGPDVAEGDLRAAVIMDEALTFHLPADVERAVFTQSRSKGLAIIASSQRLPKENHGERGAWSDHPAHIFGMRVTDLATRQILAKRVGSITYDEKQKSVSSGKATSTTESETQRRHDAIAPEDWALEAREFVLFHEAGLAPGRVKDVELNQRPGVSPIVYDPRKDIVDFMEDL